MKTPQSTRQALLMSGLVLLLCVSMLIGSTFAWFTDSVTSGNNKIAAGTLDVQLFMHNGTEYVDISDSDKPIFGTGSFAQNNAAETLWEPGKTQIVYLQVKNAGTLALKYNILVDVTDNGLAGALQYAIIDGVTKEQADQFGASSWKDILAISGVQTGNVQSGRTIAAENGALEAHNSDYFALAVHMDELADNKYQGKDIMLDIQILATQLANESDSFDNQYDADAPLDVETGMIAKVGNRLFQSIQDAVDSARNGDTIVLVNGYNTQDAQLAETIVIDKEVTLTPNGMYLVSSAPATFTVVEGGKLTVDEGSFTIKNTASNGACVFVDGGAFEMAGGSFDGYAAVRTAEGKSSEVTLSAGWSNRVSVGFELKGNDTLNVTGGTLISSKESIIADGKLTINMSGGTLSGKPSFANMYNPSVVCKGETIINMTGGKIETTATKAVAITVYSDSVVNISGDAVVAGTCCGVNTGSYRTAQGENNVVNISGNAKVTGSGAGDSYRIGHGIYANSVNTTVTVSGNAQVTSTSYGVFAPNAGCSITIADAAVIKAVNGLYSGYGLACEKITITGGAIEALEYGVLSNVANSTVVIDNSTTLTPITISGTKADIFISDTTNYTVGGNPVFDTVLR